jgi:hypothetical protein
MKTQAIRHGVMMFILALASVRITQARGQRVIAVQPSVAEAGGQISVTGSKMEPGEVFALTLEGPGGSISLGKGTATGEGKKVALSSRGPSRRIRNPAPTPCVPRRRTGWNGDRFDSDGSVQHGLGNPAGSDG